ncbi:hypothetical protein EDB19DRAFT_1633152 [Suillus lakei]|nr:hypothetical protein EDB19DRAFT_1633152 [Suillus lakei]
MCEVREKITPCQRESIILIFTQFCGIKPKYPPHQFCGRRCAAQASNLCKHCQAAPRYTDGNVTHPYCGKACARNATNAGADSFVVSSDACLSCKKRPQSQRFRYYCSSQCHQEAQQNAPQLLEIPSNHNDYTNIETQFYDSWRHTDKVRPSVRHIYKIIVSSNINKRYDNYRAKVESRGHFAGKLSSNGKAMTEGNENRRWHGTKRDCNLGDSGNTNLCSSSSCALCSIIQNGFKVRYSVAAVTTRSKFGCGIYTSSTSSKSNDYTENLKSSSLKAMLLNHVVVGKGYKLTSDQTDLNGAPSGFDSVLGEKSVSGALNHDELVVYDDGAIRPCYLVMYDE